MSRGMVSPISLSSAFRFHFCFCNKRNDSCRHDGELDEMLAKIGEYLGYVDNSNEGNDATSAEF